MPMPMQETREAILAMLSANNGLETMPYWPHPHSLDQYVIPGNYAIAESVERGANGDKFNGVILSVYEKGSYLTIQNLKVQLGQLFAVNEWCQNADVNMFHSGDELAHSVEYRFHTIGVEDSASPNGPDFCPSCGWNTAHLECNAQPDDHPIEECHYLCANCGKNTGITAPCRPRPRSVTLSKTVRSKVNLTGSQNVILDVSPGVINAVGEIMVGYALAENSLRTMLMMENVPGHEDGSYLSTDIERLKKHRKAIVASALVQSADGGQAMEECIVAIVNVFERIRPIRTALAHGQLTYVGLSTSTITTHGINQDREESSRLQIEHTPKGKTNTVTVDLTDDGMQEALDSVRELQAQVGRLRRILDLLQPLTELKAASDSAARRLEEDQ